MRFIGFGFDRDHTERLKQFDCEDSEIATARVGFIAMGKDPDGDDLALSIPALKGSPFGIRTAELIVAGNVSLLGCLGRVGLSEQMQAIQLAVTSGIGALEEAAFAEMPSHS
jgi:hypothetical protein